MKVLSCLIATLFASTVLASPSRIVLPMDTNWLFALGDPATAENPAFDDSTWRRLDVPHDWSIEGPFDEKNPTGGAGGFLPAGIGWYRKRFTLPADYSDRRIFVEFDGVMANSDVWLNGFHLGHRPYGYVSFRYELTDHMDFGAGKTNILAVRADNSNQPASRWYAGAGIYRHVRLVVTDPVHIDPWGTFITTPKVSTEQAVVHVQTVVTNESERPADVTVQLTIFAPEAATPPQTIAPGKSALFQHDVSIKNPQLWDLNHPDLYSLSTKVSSARTVLDEETLSFGIRDTRFDPATGFWLNGKNLKLQGVCLHHDEGALGAAVPLSAWERRLALLKQTGCNAIRTAHNPPAPEFLDLCDRMGFLVVDELFDCWTVGKNRADYHLYFNEWSKSDTADIVCRDRNHPSIVLYSAGNEIRDTPKAERAKEILSSLLEVFHQNDPSRPVTQALFRPNASHDYDNGLADLLDVVGQNYREDELLAAHEAKPSRKIIGTENGHDRKIWLALRDHPAYAGQFLWTGFDYLGESRRWPVIGAGSGLFDRAGTPKPRAFERQSWWSDQPMVHVVRRAEPDRATPSDPGFEPLARRQQQFSDWSPRNREPHEETVEVYSNCEQVELVLNGKSLGSKSLPPDASPRNWNVPFESGTLEALGKSNRKIVATDKLQTAGPPAKLRLTTDRSTLSPEWDDVAYIETAVVDSKGVLVPDAGLPITFSISGPGKLAAVDNGDNSSHEPFQSNSRYTYQGRCYAILRARADSGQIKLTASAPDLPPAILTLKAAPASR